jgi:hypothetical protein
MAVHLLHALTGRAAGPIAAALCLVLAAALGVTWASAAHDRAELEARIAALQDQIARPDVAWTATPAEPVAGVQPVALVGRLPAAPAAPPGPQGAAERLLKTAPTGFDACARMESADAAVLAALAPKK